MILVFTVGYYCESMGEWLDCQPAYAAPEAARDRAFEMARLTNVRTRVMFDGKHLLMGFDATGNKIRLSDRVLEQTEAAMLEAGS